MREWRLRWALFSAGVLTVQLREIESDAFEVVRLYRDSRGQYVHYDERGDGRRIVLEVDEKTARELARLYPPGARA